MAHEHAHDEQRGDGGAQHHAAHGHDHDHDRHDHDHDHHHHGLGHVHAPASFGKAFAIGIALNLAFVVAEVVYGILGNSVALLADAGHNISDVIGLAVAWLATILAKRAPSARFTFGLGGSSILAALFNAVFLLVVVGGLSWEAIARLFHPPEVAGKTVMIVAAIGIAINGACAWLFASGRKGDLNIRGAFMHMAADALVSAGVVVAGFVILLTSWLWLDPLVSLAINIVIVIGSWSLLTGSLKMSLGAVPPGIDLAKVRDYLEHLPGVVELHDLHVWPLSTTLTALTCHLVIPGGNPGDTFIRGICDELHARFNIAHATVQIETDPESQCRLAPDHVV